MSDQPVQVPAGWYPDPSGEGAERWWNGEEWSTATRTSESLPTGIQGSSAVSFVPVPTSSKAVTVMVLGIVSVVMISVFFLFSLPPAIVALVMSYNAKKEIELSQGKLTGESYVLVGRILAWSAIGVTLFLTLLFILFLSFAILGEVSSELKEPAPLR